jgi:hypothetical protein
VLSGAYSLTSINGQPLPYVLAQTGADKDELVSDVYTFSGQGSFTQATTVRQTRNGQASTSATVDAGSYVLNGTAVTVHYNSDGSSVSGVLSGRTLTLAGSGFAGVYQHQ